MRPALSPSSSQIVIGVTCLSQGKKGKQRTVLKLAPGHLRKGMAVTTAMSTMGSHEVTMGNLDSNGGSLPRPGCIQPCQPEGIHQAGDG